MPHATVLPHKKGRLSLSIDQDLLNRLERKRPAQPPTPDLTQA